VTARKVVKPTKGLAQQRFQVEIAGRLFIIKDRVTGAIVGGPFHSRPDAQKLADELERRTSF
jgi:hypothetical protein